jgi:hypothetical protein
LSFTSTQFLELTQWAAALDPQPVPPGAVQLTAATVVATYATAKDKRSEDGAALTEDEKASAQAGATVSTARSSWPASKPVVGVVTSPISDAVQHQSGLNVWHTVAMAREGNTVWVHDPEYKVADHAEATRLRVASVRGNKMVKALVDQWPTVQGVWYQGPPDTFTQSQQQCMGRSALWVEHTLQGTAPWPPDTPGSGGTWTFHHKN